VIVLGREDLERAGQREAYLPDRRVRLASDIAAASAVLLLAGLLGSGLTWWERSALFDLAANSRETIKMGSGYFAGPVLILIVLPLVFGRRRQLALKRWFRARLVLAALLWIAGLIVLLDKVAGLDGYTIEAGTYVCGALLVVGLLATLAMWPGHLPEVRVNRAGRIQEAEPIAAGPRERSRMGP
jgi:undecaprenyl pyrophosphate phosphatase UppP